MNAPLLRSLNRLFFPGAAILLASVVILQWVRMPPAFWVFAQIYPYLVLISGVLLGWGFRRSRAVFAVIVLAMAGQALNLFPAGNPKLGGSRYMLFDAIAFLLPLNLTVFAYLKERGFLTKVGLYRLGLILGQWLLVGLMVRFHWSWLAGLIHRTYINTPYMLNTPIRQPACWAFTAAVILLIVRFIRQPNTINASFLWAVIAVFIGLSLKSGPRYSSSVASLYFSTAELILVLAVIMTSHAMAYRDDLTGLPSRRALNEALATLGSHYTIAMADVDHFKKFNDKYGHDVGDQVLRMVASRLAAVQGGGKAYRYGGEEFTILYPGKSVEETIDHLEHLRKGIALTDFVVRGPDRPRKVTEQSRPRNGSTRRTRITISIGVAQKTARAGQPNLVIQAADKALYRAKNGGRNQVSE